MKIKSNISSAIISATVGMLQPFIPDLTPTRLVKALETFEDDSRKVSKPHLQKMLTIAEVCKLLQCSRPSIYRLFESGELTKVKVGGLTRVPAREVDHFLEGK